MTDFNRIIDGLTKSGVLGGLAGGLAGGALAGALGGKGAKKLGKTAVKAGAIAAVGGIAWKAWQTWQAQQQAAAAGAPAEPPALPAPAHDLLLIRAMIAAAYADGHIDATEQTRIFDRVDSMNLAPDDKALLFDELRRPLGLRELTELTPPGETAVEVYAAALVAADRSQPATKRYLAELASRLQLPDGLVAQVHAEADDRA
ncbi:MAG: tellurite resistance TerB family protein [Pseudomonadales bacterium]|nr:tellurite resistance TerB family protein [Pseudomonadales bacterium]